MEIAFIRGMVWKIDAVEVQDAARERRHVLISLVTRRIAKAHRALMIWSAECPNGFYSFGKARSIWQP
ncbi:MAG: hypothetical protein Kow0090_05040 [Myxococcota bacterium]